MNVSIIGLFKLFIPSNLRRVFCKRVLSLFGSIFIYCFGKHSLDSGQSLDPFPPERISGINLSLKLSNVILLLKNSYYYKPYLNQFSLQLNFYNFIF